MTTKMISIVLVFFISCFYISIDAMNMNWTSICKNDFNTLTRPQLVYHKRIPIFTPVLISAPFGGSVAARELIEYTTGYYSGSFELPHLAGYSSREEKAQLEYFPRFGNCSLDSSVVAVDEYQRANFGLHGTFSFTIKKDLINCRRGGIYNFARMILIVRNPFLAILKEFESKFHPNLDFSYGHASANDEDTYPGIIDFTNPNIYSAWKEFAVAGAKSYETFWEKHIVHSAEILLHLMLIVRYEDIVSTDANLVRDLAASLFTFSQHRAVIFNASVSYPSRIDCGPHLMQHKDHEQLDVSRLKGEPYHDTELVYELMGYMRGYIDAFSYDPPSATLISDLISSGNLGPNTLNNDTSSSDAKTDSNIEESSFVSVSAEEQKLRVCLRTVHMSNRTKIRKVLVQNSQSLPPIVLSTLGSGSYLLAEYIEATIGHLTAFTGMREPPPSDTFPELRACTRKAALIVTDWARSFEVQRGRHLLFRRPVDQQFCSTSEGQQREMTNTTDFNIASDHLKNIPHSINKLRGVTSPADELYSDRMLTPNTVTASMPIVRKVIILVRNPYESLAAAFERLITANDDVPKIDFTSSVWKDFALSQARLLSTSWLPQFESIVSHVAVDDLFLVDYQQLVNDKELLKVINKILTMIPEVQLQQPLLSDESTISCLRMLANYQQLYFLNASRYRGIPYDFLTAQSFVAELQTTLRPFLLRFGFDPSPPESISLGGPKSANALDAFRKPPIVSAGGSGAGVGSPLVTVETNQSLTDHDVMMSFQLKRIKCSAKFGRRHFCSAAHKGNDVPPLLLSFPGAGNTWIRLLVEYSTGYYTGCIYNRDVILDRDFIGERYCSRQVSVIKAHPQDLTMREKFGRKLFVLKERGMRLKCESGAVRDRDIRQVIFISRNPYRCILSEFHRQTMSTTRGNAHQLSVTLGRFNRTEWQIFALRLAKEYDALWRDYLGDLFNSTIIQSQLIRYEDMLSKTKRKDNLKEIVRFTNRDQDGSCLGKNWLTSAGSESVSEFEARLDCAFLLADTRRTHRGGIDESELSPADRPVTAQIAYLDDPELIAAMWPYLQKYSEHFGYSMKI